MQNTISKLNLFGELKTKKKESNPIILMNNLLDENKRLKELFSIEKFKLKLVFKSVTYLQKENVFSSKE